MLLHPFAMRHVLFGLLLAPAILHKPAKFAQAAVTDWGDKTFFGDGYMRAYFTYHGSIPHELGVEISPGLYENTPTEPSDGKNDVRTNTGQGVVWYCCGYEIKPPFPDSVKELTAFEHAVMNFNPYGHPPPEIYDAAHIDFHFYTQTEKERLAIPGVKKEKDMCGPTIPMTCEDFEELGADLPCDQAIVDYANVGAVEPEMANHLIDITSPEFEGSEFTHTFIYNTCYGRICGFEPMITNEFIQGLKSGRKKVCKNIKTPAKLPESGFYPTKYCMEYKETEDVFVVFLKNWKMFEESDGVCPGRV